MGMDSKKESMSAGIEQRRVVIENSHGEKLVGKLHDTGSKELVVFCHGLHSSKVILLSLSLCPSLITCF